MSSEFVTESSTMSKDEDPTIDSLIPALIQCFGVIVLGYLAGRWGALTDIQVQGLNSYVTKFALPALFFKVMVSIDFNDVHWLFVIAVSLSKLVIFILAFSFTLMLSRKCELGIAGILSMFASQSNDVALGYPVLYSLYPDLASYVYLFAPAQLIVLNPISYVFLEWHQLNARSRAPNQNPLLLSSSRTTSRSRCRRWLQVFWRVVLNPIFFMTVIGVVFNFILHHTLPAFVDGLLKVLADSFTATALFTLGFGMVGKMGHITRREIYILVAILMLKLIICPFVTRELCVQLVTDTSTANDSLRYSTFGFLYGVIPTAPPVYLFAVEYDVLPTVIGVGLVLGTFLSAPIMFVLARMITVYMAKPSKYDQLLENAMIDVSWMSIACCVWTTIVLFLSRKAFRVPHRFTVCHLCCVLLSCIGAVVGFFLNRKEDLHGVVDWHNHMMNSPAEWAHYIQFSIFFIGCTGARIWTMLIAFAMVLERIRGTCSILRYQACVFLTGWILPLIITSTLLLTTPRQLVKDVSPIFQYGRAQLITSLVVLLVSTIGTILCMISYIRHGSSMGDHTAAYHSLLSSPDPCSDTPALATFVEQNQIGDEDPDDTDAHSLMLAPQRQSCRCIESGYRRECSQAMARYSRLCNRPSIQVPTADPATSNPSEYQHQQHLVLLFILLTTMFFGICLCTWRLIHEAPSGVYVVLEFLDGTFNFGQGLALFIIFGLDADLIVLPIKGLICRCLRKLFPRPTPLDPIAVPPEEDPSVQKVYQFVRYHLATCEATISTKLGTDSDSIKAYPLSALEQWLLDSGLTRCNSEATDYVHILLSNEIIAPVPHDIIHRAATTNFSSSTTLYTFTDKALELGHSPQ